MHRKFYLENELGQRYNLQDLKGAALLTAPAGLGLAMQREYELSGDAGLCVKGLFPIRCFTGTVVFNADKAYDGYRALANFIASATTLKLAYAPRYETASGEFLSDIEVESLGKTEIRGGRMECDLVITLKSPWYKRESLRVVADKSEDELRYERVYDFTYNDVSTDYIEILNDGHFDAAIALEAEGELVNPKLTLFVGGVKRAELSVTTIIAAGETLLYSTKDTELILKKRLADGSEESLLDSISVENDNFFKLPRGLSVLSLSADNEITSKSVITVWMAYKAV